MSMKLVLPMLLSIPLLMIFTVMRGIDKNIGYNVVGKDTDELFTMPQREDHVRVRRNDRRREEMRKAGDSPHSEERIVLREPQDTGKASINNGDANTDWESSKSGNLSKQDV